eukprot:Em0395g3a
MGKGVKEFLQKQLVQFGHFIYNPKTKELFGRTGLSWIQILAYPHSPDVRPWNFGRYAYPNYPNAKIALISLPSGILYNQSLSSDVLNQIRTLTKVQNLTCGQFQDNKNCVFIYIARTFDWKPELIDSAIGNNLAINCWSNKKVNFTYSPQGGIPLDLPNNVDSTNSSRSFPFRRQDNFTLPVMSVWINTPDSSLPLTVTCEVPVSSLVTPTFRTNGTLDRIYEYPKIVQFTVGS